MQGAAKDEGQGEGRKRYKPACQSMPKHAPKACPMRTGGMDERASIGIFVILQSPPRDTLWYI